jgi:hypothetical protein
VRAIVDARSTTGGKGKRRRTVRVTRYAKAWEVALGIGDEPQERARAAALLYPEQARAVAAYLIDAAKRAEVLREEAEADDA